MRIGLCGAHRTGKSTLAAAVAKQFGLEQIVSPVSPIAKRYGFDMDKHRRDEPRFTRMQREILVTLVTSVGARSQFISDRTPIDAAAYLIADVQANTGESVFQQEVIEYQSKALAAADHYYDAIIIVPPAIPFDAQDGKPGANLAYQEHHHLICAGLLTELSIPTAHIPREMTSLQERVNAIGGLIGAFRDQRAAKSGLVL